MCMGVNLLVIAFWAQHRPTGVSCLQLGFSACRFSIHNRNSSPMDMLASDQCLLSQASSRTMNIDLILARPMWALDAAKDTSGSMPRSRRISGESSAFKPNNCIRNLSQDDSSLDPLAWWAQVSLGTKRFGSTGKVHAKVLQNFRALGSCRTLGASG